MMIRRTSVLATGRALAISSHGSGWSSPPGPRSLCAGAGETEHGRSTGVRACRRRSWTGGCGRRTRIGGHRAHTDGIRVVSGGTRVVSMSDTACADSEGTGFVFTVSPGQRGARPCRRLERAPAGRGAAWRCRGGVGLRGRDHIRSPRATDGWPSEELAVRSHSGAHERDRVRSMVILLIVTVIRIAFAASAPLAVVMLGRAARVCNVLARRSPGGYTTGGMSTSDPASRYCPLRVAPLVERAVGVA